jgi:hypothetical protein
VAVITFDGVAGAAGYVLERPGADDVRCQIDVLGRCLAPVGGPATSCSYRLVAVDDDGVKGTPSDPFCITRVELATTRRR